MSQRHWVASYGRHASADINPDACSSVLHLMEDAMQRHAERIAFRSFDSELSYADVDRLSLAFSAYLQHELGVKKGDRVAVMLPNLLAFPITMLGIVRAGCVQVNVNPLYTARELEHQLNDAGVQTIVVFAGSTPTLAEVIGRTSVRHVVTVAVGDGGKTALPSPPVDARLSATRPFAQALERGASLAHQRVELQGSDLLFLQYTGGTTGVSKGAMLSHRNLVANTEQFKAFYPSTLQDGGGVIVTALPLYHIYALMVNFIGCFSLGATNWLVANPRDTDGLVDVLARSKLTVFTGVNTLYAALVQHPRIREVDFSRLRIASGGGAAVIPATSAQWQAITGRFISEGYGLSETSPIVSGNPEWVREFTASTGLPVPSTDIKLLDDSDLEVAIGQPGEICVKGPQVMSGYWKKPEANADAFTSDGYFRTGDVGVFDELGFLRIVDRKKDMINVSGFNVYPNEVEAVATAFKGVAECACIGTPDAKSGEAVTLFVVAAAGHALDAQALIAHCRAEMAAYKVPKIVRLVDSLPKSAVGKILRRELRHLA